MTPLFKLPVTGGVLVGYENKNCSCKSSYEYAHCKQVCRPSLMNEAWRLENFGSHHFIGPLSEVTEEMAKELGFESTYKDRAKDYLQVAIWDRIHHEGKTRAVEDDLSDVLLIMVNNMNYERKIKSLSIK